MMAVERATIDLPPELKYWPDKRVRKRKVRGDRKASLRALVVELLEKEAKTTPAYPVVA
jgi:hypothetical protein